MAINDIRDDLRQECEKFGVVKKILLFDVKACVAAYINQHCCTILLSQSGTTGLEVAEALNFN